MKRHQRGRWKTKFALLAVIAAAIAPSHAAPPSGRACQRVELQGEVIEGHEWKVALGQGWTFRVLPIAGYSGWDLAVDRDPPAGYPDALLLATLPYDSINEREIGTTFGLRAQDAVGWNPRSFRFLTDTKDFREASLLYLHLFRAPKNSTAGGEKAALARLLEVEKRASSGQLRILDARLVPGTRDPQPFAQAWALAFARSQFHIEPVAEGQASAEGKLVWMRFVVTLWLPSGWNFPAAIKPVRAPCPE